MRRPPKKPFKRSPDPNQPTLFNDIPVPSPKKRKPIPQWKLRQIIAARQRAKQLREKKQGKLPFETEQPTPKPKLSKPRSTKSTNPTLMKPIGSNRNVKKRLEELRLLRMIARVMIPRKRPKDGVPQGVRMMYADEFAYYRKVLDHGLTKPKELDSVELSLRTILRHTIPFMDIQRLRRTLKRSSVDIKKEELILFLQKYKLVNK